MSIHIDFSGSLPASTPGAPVTVQPGTDALGIAAQWVHRATYPTEEWTLAHAAHAHMLAFDFAALAMSNAGDDIAGHVKPIADDAIDVKTGLRVRFTREGIHALSVRTQDASEVYVRIREAWENASDEDKAKLMDKANTRAVAMSHRRIEMAGKALDEANEFVGKLDAEGIPPASTAYRQAVAKVGAAKAKAKTERDALAYTLASMDTGASPATGEDTVAANTAANIKANTGG